MCVVVQHWGAWRCAGGGRGVPLTQTAAPQSHDAMWVAGASSFGDKRTRLTGSLCCLTCMFMGSALSPFLPPFKICIACSLGLSGVAYVCSREVQQL